MNQLKHNTARFIEQYERLKQMEMNENNLTILKKIRIMINKIHELEVEEEIIWQKVDRYTVMLNEVYSDCQIIENEVAKVININV